MLLFAGKEEAMKLSIPRASSLNENVDHSALLKLGGTVSERIHRFDSKTAAVQETRRIFEQRTLQVSSSPCLFFVVVFFFSIHLHENHWLRRRLCQEKQAATNRILLKKERASGFQGSRLDVVARFNGSTEALDRLDDPPAPTLAPSSAGPNEAVSPTVSQLSAVFEKAEPQNNLYLSQRRSAPALAPKPKLQARADPAEKKVRKEVGIGEKFVNQIIVVMILIWG